jgi:two-component system chemotaxis response regulator CheB
VERKRVLVVDDSATVRQVLTEIINSSDDLEVIGTAMDPYQAREKIKKLNPDVLTLDVEMPKMDGISFLRNLMRLRPMPVLMISTLTEKGSQVTIDALELGAFDCIRKPDNLGAGLTEYSELIVEKLKAATSANVKVLESTHINSPNIQKRNKDIVCKPRPNALIAIGASTGGTEAIKEVLLTMPTNCPPIVATQHIPPVFSASYAQRMDRICDIRVYEATHGQKLEAGSAYIAPGHSHMEVEKRGSHYYATLNDKPPVNRHRPAVDVLFDSVAAVAGKSAVAVLLTGMGADGAQGMLHLKEAGAFTMIQDESTSVVWGMPGAAARLQAHEVELPLNKIGHKIIEKINKA